MHNMIHYKVKSRWDISPMTYHRARITMYVLFYSYVVYLFIANIDLFQ